MVRATPRAVMAPTDIQMTVELLRYILIPEKETARLTRTKEPEVTIALN
jgi:hypothetical protein